MRGTNSKDNFFQKLPKMYFFLFILKQIKIFKYIIIILKINRFNIYLQGNQNITSDSIDKVFEKA